MQLYPLCSYILAFQESLEKAKMWLSELEKEFCPEEIIVALVGNKLDLSAVREVTSQVGTILHKFLMFSNMHIGKIGRGLEPNGTRLDIPCVLLLPSPPPRPSELQYMLISMSWCV